MDVSEALKKRGVNILSAIFDSLKNSRKIDLSELENYVNDLIDEIAMGKSERKYEPILSSSEHEYPITHSVNVTILSIMFASKLKISAADMHDIGLGAMLHDVGKINTPDSLLWKQDGAGDADDAIINEHVVFGPHWMSSYSMITESVLGIIRDHHENFAGSGYPKGVSDRELWVGVRIVSLCNYYDFLVTEVGTKKALSPREACFEIFLQINRKFGHKLVNAFFNEIGPMVLDGPLFQKTALVMLTSKEVAAIMKIDSFGDTQPEILVLTNPQGVKLVRPVPVNLKKDSSRKISRILKG